MFLWKTEIENGEFHSVRSAVTIVYLRERDLDLESYSCICELVVHHDESDRWYASSS